MNKGKKTLGKFIITSSNSAITFELLKETFYKMNNPMYGKHHTDEAKAAVSAKLSGENGSMYGKPPANKGIPHTDEEKAKISAAVSGEKNGFFGKHHTEEEKERNCQAHLGKPSVRKGISCSEKTKAILREKALARAAKAAAEENLAAANTTPTNLSSLLDAVILQQCLRSEIAVA